MITNVPPLVLMICGGCDLGELTGSHCVEFLRELIVEVWPRQASVLACVILVEISEGLAGPSEEARCRCCGTG